MVILVQLIGSYKNKQGPNHCNLEFYSTPTLRDVISSALTFFKEHGKIIEEHYMMVAVDGRIVLPQRWDMTYVYEGQLCLLFPPLQGG
ncbi:MAG: MoaD/ThiS family protein [Bacillota bacterium]|nr:MoaD/ThiS family protein [Bacillota bacterium]